MEALSAAVSSDFPVECEIVLDQFNNAIMLKKKPASPPPPTAPSKRRSRSSPPVVDEGYILPTDRNHKPIAKRYTTRRVEGAIAEYVSAVGAATCAVRSALQDLSTRLKDDMPVLVNCLHLAVVMQVANQHTLGPEQSTFRSLPGTRGHSGFALVLTMASRSKLFTFTLSRQASAVWPQCMMLDMAYIMWVTGRCGACGGGALPGLERAHTPAP